MSGCGAKPTGKDVRLMNADIVGTKLFTSGDIVLLSHG